MKQKRICLLLAALVLAAFLSGCGREFKTNTAQKSGELLPIPEGQQASASPDGTFSFLCPSSATVQWDEDGAYVYTVSPGETPYILVYYAKGTSFQPDSYFASYARMVKKEYKEAKFGKISQTTIGEKTLYMLRSEVKGDGTTYVIDRYLEIYPDCSVQYTIKTNHAGSEDPVFAALVESLCFGTDIYGEPEQPALYGDLRSVANAEVGISMSAPGGLEMQQIPIGLFAQDEHMLLFASYQNSDAAGAAIYDADDFLARIGSVEGLLQAQLGVDSVSIQNGAAEQVGNFQAYVFPLQVAVGSFTGSGKLYLTNAANAGCYILYYAVAEGSGLESFAEQCISSFSADSAPQNTPQYQMFTDSQHSFSFLYRAGVTDKTAQDMGGIAAIELSDSDFVLVTPLSQSTEGVSSASEYLTKYAQELQTNHPEIAYTVSGPAAEPGGRYAFETVKITYTYEETPRVLTLSACDGANGTIWTVLSTGTEASASALKTLHGDILWSLRVN